MPLSTRGPSNGQAKTKTVTGQFIAKATVGYPKHQRARDAARWLRHELDIEPTAKLAAATFGVSIPTVRRQSRLLEQRDRGRKHHAVNGGGTTALSDDAVERIVVELGPDRVLRVVDKLTSPQLPLVAAE